MPKHAGTLLITHPSGRQEAIPLQGAYLRIGSAADNDMVLLAPTMAAHHATLGCSEHGDLTITIAGIEIGLPRASASAATLRIGGYVLNYVAGEIADQASGYVIRQASPAAQYARTDETALLSALLAGDEWAAQAPRLLESHEAVTIEMPALSVERANDR